MLVRREQSYTLQSTILEPFEDTSPAFLAFVCAFAGSEDFTVTVLCNADYNQDRYIGHFFAPAASEVDSVHEHIGTASWLIRFIEKIIWEKGKPNNIRSDNGPEFITHEFQNWSKGNDINLLHTQPGCPTQNSYIERFNDSYRRAVLDACIFRTLEDVREITEKWRNYYNNERPHDILNNLAPMEWLARTG